jgi:chromosome partitioning protein
VRTIGIINQKGGCGKTTVSINLAAVLAAKGFKTLLVDMDPQSHCALGLAVPDAQIERSMADLLRAGLDGSIGLPDVIWQISRNFDLAPSSIALAGIEAQLAPASDRDRRLAHVLSTVQDKYDFCIVDCPPSIGLLTFNALRASDEVLIPVETGYFALQGSVKQEQTIQMLARRANHHVRFRVLATMYDVRTKLAREILGELKRHFGDVLLPVVINFNAKLKEAASFGQPITEYDAASRGMQDFEQLVQWLLANPPQRPAVAGEAGTAAGTADSSAMIGAAAQPLSRAAELVERARALSARTAALSSRLTHDPDAIREGIAPRPPQPHEDELVRTASATLPALVPVSPSGSSTGGGTAVATRPELEAKLARLYGVRKTHEGLLFIQPGIDAREVAIAGDFNQWDPHRTPLRRDDRLNIWQAVVDVPPGRYRYRLVIDGQWKPDPYNTAVESNSFGEVDNVIEA